MRRLCSSHSRREVRKAASFGHVALISWRVELTVGSGGGGTGLFSHGFLYTSVVTAAGGEGRGG